MSDSQAYEEITVVSDGISVTKRFEADEFPVPAIAFNFESDADEPVTVSLTDAVPDDVAVEDLGFHPEYGSEHWTIDDHEIRFEREVEPGTEYTTVYGIRATGTDNVEQFLTEPSLERLDSTPEDDTSDLVGEGSDAVKDVIEGDQADVPGLEESADEDVETLDLKDPNNEAAGAATDSERTAGDSTAAAAESPASKSEDSEGGADDSQPVEPTTDRATESLIAAMAAELRNNQVAKEDVQILRKAFDLADDTDGSVTARIDKIQADVSEVLAYTDALEEFLDENGTGDELIAEFESEVESFRDEVESFESALDDLQSTATANDEQIDALVDQMETIEDDLASVREQMGDDDVQDRIDDIDQEISELKEWREQLSSVIGGGD